MDLKKTLEKKRMLDSSDTDNNITKKDVAEIKQEFIKNKQPVYVGDIESLLSQVSNQVPLMNNETLLMAEIDLQYKIFGAITGIGLMMMAFAFLI